MIFFAENRYPQSLRNLFVRNQITLSELKDASDKNLLDLKGVGPEKLSEIRKIFPSPISQMPELK